MINYEILLLKNSEKNMCFIGFKGKEILMADVQNPYVKNQNATP